MVIGSLLNVLGLVLLLLSMRPDEFQRYLMGASIVSLTAGVASVCISWVG